MSNGLRIILPIELPNLKIWLNNYQNGKLQVKTKCNILD